MKTFKDLEAGKVYRITKEKQGFAEEVGKGDVFKFFGSDGVSESWVSFLVFMDDSETMVGSVDEVGERFQELEGKHKYFDSLNEEVCTLGWTEEFGMGLEDVDFGYEEVTEKELEKAGYPKVTEGEEV